MKSKAHKTKSGTNPFKKNRFLVFILCFGILGVVLLKLSLAADLEHPLGYADSCALVGNNTIIKGWVHDNDAVGTPGALPTLRITLSNGSYVDVSSNVSNYRETQIDNFLLSYNRPASDVYGFEASFANLYKDTAYGISGRIKNVGAGADQDLWINSSGPVDGGSLPYFTNNQIPSACLGTRPAPAPTTPSTPNPTPTPQPPATKPKTTTTAPKQNTPAAQPDTQAPSVPADLSGSFNESAVDLSWSGSTDNTGIRGYKVERSADNASWQLVSNNEDASQDSYTDNTVAFNTTYYYRVQAVDLSGNSSGYATTTVQTGTFEANASKDKELVLASDDGVISLTIPAGALVADAVCALDISSHLAPALKNYTTASGPYEMFCKQADGTRVASYAQPITVAFKLSPSVQKRFTGLQAYVYQGDGWQPAEAAGQGSFVLGDSSDFVIMGKLKKTPLWQKIIIVVVVLGGIALAGLMGLRWWYRWKVARALAKKQADYHNKERGY